MLKQNFTRTRWLQIALSTLIFLFSLGINNAWADYTVSFKDNGSGSGDGTTAQTTIANLISSGSDYVNSISASKAYNGKDGFGIKLGSSSATGNVEMTMKSTGTYIGQIKASKLTIHAAYYDKDKTMKVTVTYTDATTRDSTYSALTASIAGYDLTLNDTKTVQKIKIASVTSSKGRIYVESVDVVAASSCSNKVALTKGSPSNGTFSLTHPSQLHLYSLFQYVKVHLCHILVLTASTIFYFIFARTRLY